MVSCDVTAFLSGLRAVTAAVTGGGDPQPPTGCRSTGIAANIPPTQKTAAP